ncbi:MAG TPA: 3-oxoacyl-[acyl-carrier-protein] synthase III C-terminal domain-containing protein [Acidimicrobiales bacterium]|nr:3-oxoacyl-[acyl-carrier-protein] synthase III C-terminal domain-containing protein [Acidimicrobiales bacterium]
MSAAITGIGSASPCPVPQQRLWDEFFAEHFSEQPRAREIWANAGVRSRGAAVMPVDEDVSSWGTDARMRRFVEEALPLGETAIVRCLDDAGIGPGDVELFTVVSCTGYPTPGLDVLLADRLAMRPSTQRLQVGAMGCYGALPGLAAVADAATARGRMGLMLCVEITSVHLQPPTDDLQQVVAHALFADAAAAVVVSPARAGLEVIAVVSRTDTSRAGEMTWTASDHGFTMTLSPRVPGVLADHVQGVVSELLGAHGLGTGDVTGWAVHPGGPRILDVVAERLGLDDQLQPSRNVLAEHGNCSSPTVLLVLERLLASHRVGLGDHVVLLAFGPGLTLYAVLLRCRGS